MSDTKTIKFDIPEGYSFERCENNQVVLKEDIKFVWPDWIKAKYLFTNVEQSCVFFTDVKPDCVNGKWRLNSKTTSSQYSVMEKSLFDLSFLSGIESGMFENPNFNNNNNSKPERKYQEVVSRGVKWLNKNHPNWVNMVDWYKLNMNDVTRCVLSQVVVDEYYSHVRDWRIECGFELGYGSNSEEYKKLALEWRFQAGKN